MKTTIVKSRFKSSGSIRYFLFVNNVPIEWFASQEEAQRKIEEMKNTTPHLEWLAEYADAMKEEKTKVYNRLYERVKE